MASGLTIKIKGVEGIQKHFAKIANPAKVREAVVNSTAIVLSTAKHYVPVGREGGGGLRNSIHMKVEQSEDGIVGKVFAGGGHAMYVEFGTGVVGEASNYPKAGELGLKYAHYSWTYTPDGGEHFYTTKGYRARPFMYPALNMNKAQIKKLITNALKEGIK